MTSTSFNVGLNSGVRNSSKVEQPMPEQDSFQTSLDVAPSTSQAVINLHNSTTTSTEVFQPRVLKPPGGGSSDIFGSGDGGEPQRRGRNHNISSFSLGGEDVVAPARKPGNDSFFNLFGTNEPQSRPSTAIKDKFRSNIILDQTDDTNATAKKSLFVEDDNCTDKETSKLQNNNGECIEIEKNGNEPSCDGCQEVQTLQEEGELTRTETQSNGTPEVAQVSVESVSTNGSTSSTESTPAPTPTPTASAPSKQRVPPGGFSSGLW